MISEIKQQVSDQMSTTLIYEDMKHDILLNVMKTQHFQQAKSNKD